MKTLCTLLLINVIFLHYSFAQLVAGTLPAGATSTNANVTFSSSTDNVKFSKTFDLDCDGTDDVRIRIQRGNQVAGDANFAAISVLNSDFSICANTALINGLNFISKFYTLGETMNCTGSYSWKPDTLVFLGDDGGTLPPHGPAHVENKYIEFRKLKTGGEDDGWIKLSFNVQSYVGSTSSLSVTDVSSFCTGTTGVPDFAKNDFSITSNPSFDRQLQIHCADNISRTEIINQLGQTVNIAEGNQTNILLPEQKGIYIIRVWTDKGGYWNRKVVR